MFALTQYNSILLEFSSVLISASIFYFCVKTAVLTEESCNLLGGLGHVHLKHKVCMSAESQQAALLGAQLYKLLQNARVLLSGESL